jgi:capsule polysaccharide export protein KpsE/RkpR
MEKKSNFTDYLSILFKWKKFIIINFTIVAIVTVVITLLITNLYKSKAVIMLSEQQGLNALGALSNVGSLFGGFLGGSGDTQIDKIFGYLESNRLRNDIINRFDLEDYYEFSEYRREKTLKQLKEDLTYDLTDNGFIEISMIHSNSDSAANIINYLVKELDKLNREIILQNASNYRKFVEKRYFKNIADLKQAQEDMKLFQTEYGVYTIPEQFKVTFEAIGNLEVELFKKKIQLDIIGINKGVKSNEYDILKSELQKLESNLEKIRAGNYSDNQSLIFLPQNKLPEIYKKYFTIFGEIEIQTKLLEFILPMYEQAMMEEQKNIPTLIVVDEAVPSELKYFPKRSFIVISVLFLLLIIHLITVPRLEKVISMISTKNEVEKIEYKSYSFLKKLYRI